METLGGIEFKPKNGDGSAVEDTPRNRCLEFIKQLVKWENSNNPMYIEPARELIAAAHKFLHPDAEGDAPKVLDPFAGGGAIPLEALRLGCEAHAVELNPVAHLIELCTLVYPQKYGQPNSRPVPDYIKRLIVHNKAKKRVKGEQGLFDGGEATSASDNNHIIPDVEITEEEYRKNPLAADVKYWATLVREFAFQELHDVYAGPSDEGEPVAFLWTRTFQCTNPACGCEVPLIQTKAVHQDSAGTAILDIGYRKGQLEFDLRTIRRPSKYDLEGTMSRNSCACPQCQTVIHKSDLEQIGKTTGFRNTMTCVVESDGQRKKCRLPNKGDIKRFETAQSRLCELEKDRKNRDELPDGELPYLRSIFNVHVYGLDRWRKVFNSRQFLALAILAKKIRELPSCIAACHDHEYSSAIATYLTLALGRQADYSSSLCLWSHSGGFLAHTFGRQALPMVWDYAEGNPFSSMTGNWLGGVDWILRVITFLSETPAASATVKRGDATRIPFGDRYFDSIVTDPPYYDAIPYSNLSDFFYVWFRFTLRDILPSEFSTPLAPKGPEIVQLAERNSAYKHKTKEFFEEGMRKAFRDGVRVLDDNGLYTIVFAHKTTAAWETLVGALIAESLVVSASWPLHTERPGRLRAHASAALASSVFLVCRRRKMTVGSGLWDDVRQELKTVAQERLDFFWNQGIRGADFFISAIGPALSVFGKYERVTKLSGEEVTVGQFLDEVRGLVTTYALAKILKATHTGAIDPESRFYVVWKWSYRDSKVPADESFKLSQALGFDTASLWDRTGVLEKSGENVQANTIDKRIKIKNLGEPSADGTPASLVDALHRMCAFREKNDTQGMGEFLARSGHANNNSLWLVAQAVSEILPDGDKEKQLMQGLLNQKEGLEEAARERRLF